MTREPVWRDVGISENQAGCDLDELGIMISLAYSGWFKW